MRQVCEKLQHKAKEDEITCGGEEVVMMQDMAKGLTDLIWQTLWDFARHVQTVTGMHVGRCDACLENGKTAQPHWTIGSEFLSEPENRNSGGYTAEGLECQGEGYLFMQDSNVIKSVPYKY